MAEAKRWFSEEVMGQNGSLDGNHAEVTQKHKMVSE